MMAVELKPLRTACGAASLSPMFELELGPIAEPPAPAPGDDRPAAPPPPPPHCPAAASPAAAPSRPSRGPNMAFPRRRSTLGANLQCQRASGGGLVPPIRFSDLVCPGGPAGAEAEGGGIVRTEVCLKVKLGNFLGAGGAGGSDSSSDGFYESEGEEGEEGGLGDQGPDQEQV